MDRLLLISLFKNPGEYLKRKKDAIPIQIKQTLLAMDTTACCPKPYDTSEYKTYDNPTEILYASVLIFKFKLLYQASL